MQTIVFLLIGLAAGDNHQGETWDMMNMRAPAVDTTHLIGHPTVPKHFCNDRHYSLCNCDNGRYGPCQCHCDNHKCCTVKNDTQLCEMYVNWPDIHEVNGANVSRTYENCGSYMTRVNEMCAGKPFIQSRESECKTAGFTCWKSMNMEYGCSVNETTNSQLGMCIMERMNYNDARNPRCKFDCNGTFSDSFTQPSYLPFWSSLNNTNLTQMPANQLCESAVNHLMFYQDQIQAVGVAIGITLDDWNSWTEKERTVNPRSALPGSTFNIESWNLAKATDGRYNVHWKTHMDHYFGVNDNDYHYVMQKNAQQAAAKGVHYII